MRASARYAAGVILWVAFLAGRTLATAPEDASAAAEARILLDMAGARGGLIVYLGGGGDGALPVALRAGEGCLVHALVADAAAAASARAAIAARGLYGPVSVDTLSGRRLPYADNLVKLLAAESADLAPMEEILRVLAPGGVACVRRDGRWTTHTKPRPDSIDEWTHFLHGPDNNAVARDTVVGPPERCQWIAAPPSTRSHDHLNSLSALVSAGGRLFYIADEGPILSVALAPAWRLIARDAFSGVRLWSRPIGPWEGHLRGFRSGPAEIARRLVAVGDRVYATLGYGRPISLLDAATGGTVRDLAGTDNALEFVVADGTVFAVAGDRPPDNTDGAAIPARPTDRWNHWAVWRETPPRKRLVAVTAATGAVRWSRETPDLLPTALAVSGGRVFYQDRTHVVALDAADGTEVWRTARPSNPRRPSWSAPTLVVQGNVVISADRSVDAPHPGADPAGGPAQWIVSSQGGLSPEGEMLAFAADSGTALWKAPCREVYNAPVDVLVVDGLVWSGSMVSKRDSGVTRALNLLDGMVARTRTPDQDGFTIGMGHHRCYRNKATARYLLLGRDGIEWIDVASGNGIGQHWVRGSCQYGIMPANGLLYAPPHSCACHIETKINGFHALAAAGAAGADASGARLERGPAYGAPERARPLRDSAGGWPTYRSDATRSGRAAAAVPTNVAVAWRARPGGALSAVSADAGRCFVASIDRHSVHAFDLRVGRPLWTFTAGGRVDSPPTLHGGAAIFGCADGWIYSVAAADGRLAWRFRAAPCERRIVVNEQIESAWPVHGSVLVHDGVVVAVAGRCSYLDDGLRLVRLDAATGELVSETPIREGALPDVPALAGGSVYVRHRRFSLGGEPLEGAEPHLFSPAGYLNGTWWHRTYWIYGTLMRSGYGGWPVSGSRTPAGRLLVADDDTIYGFGRFNQYDKVGGHVGLGSVEYKLFAAPKSAAETSDRAPGRRAAGAENRVPARWTRDVPMLVRGMVSAGDLVWIAGPPNRLVPADAAAGHPYLPAPEAALRAQAAALDGQQGAMLWAVAAADGQTRAEVGLDAVPVWDGLAAVNGRLLLALGDGSLLCLRGGDGPVPR